MAGELIGVWSETWREVWLPLIDEPLREGEDGVPEDISCELYREPGACRGVESPRNSGEARKGILYFWSDTPELHG